MSQIREWMRQADRKLDWLIGQLAQENRMSQALTSKLAELGTKEDQLIALLNTDTGIIASLNAANDALKAAQGDDATSVAEVQALIDRLTPVITPTPIISPPPAGSDPTNGPGSDPTNGPGSDPTAGTAIATGGASVPTAGGETPDGAEASAAAAGGTIVGHAGTTAQAAGLDGSGMVQAPVPDAASTESGANQPGS